MKYISYESIIKTHDNLIRDIGGDYGIRDDELLRYSVDAPSQEVFGMELYPSVFDKAAKLAESFAKYQIFYDGNKRIGAASCVMMLKLNGYELDLSNQELYDMTMKIANDKDFEWKQISKYLENHSKEIEFAEFQKDLEAYSIGG